MVCACVALGHDLALVDPDLDADATEGRLGLAGAVINVGAKSVKRDTAVGVHLRTTHFCTAEATGNLNLHALGA
jgi:hypothetical protein